MPELSRLQRVDAIPAAGTTVDITATPEECAAIALRLGVPALHSLSARIQLRPETEGTVLAVAVLNVRLDRDCIVTMEPFTTRQREKFRVRFVPTGQESAAADPEAEDDIPYIGGLIDLGEALVEQLALDLDPYPRSPGAVLPGEDAAPVASPFAALAALRKKG